MLIIPGHTHFTRIFDGSGSFAMPRVNVITAPFDVVYAGAPGPPPSRQARRDSQAHCPRPCEGGPTVSPLCISIAHDGSGDA